MRTDMVVVKPSLLEEFRKARRLSRIRLFHCLGLNPRTGGKLMARRPVSMATAEKAAAGMGIEVESLIESWADDEQAQSE